MSGSYFGPRFRLRLIGCFAAAVMLVVLPGVGAQSGRKNKRPPPQPPVQGINQPEARTVPEAEIEAAKEKPKENLPGVIIASDIPDISTSSFFADIARQACAAELREGRYPDIREARDKHRVDAIKIAKEDEVFVVHIELRLDEFRSRANGRYEFDLRYTIYEPKSGKMVHAGSGFPSQRNTRQAPPVGYGYEQRQIELMGRDAGAKALQYLRQNAQPPRPLALAR